VNLPADSGFHYAVRTYFSYPKDNKSPEKAVFIISDVFGLFNNGLLLADQFAANGYLAVLPDLFNGDQLDVGDVEAGKVDFPTWIGKHGIETVEPVVEATIKHLREDLGVKKIAAAGYCFGGKVRFFPPTSSNRCMFEQTFADHRICSFSTLPVSSRTARSTSVIPLIPPSSPRRNLLLSRSLSPSLPQVRYFSSSLPSCAASWSGR
jgi:hypothetical protein